MSTSQFFVGQLVNTNRGVGKIFSFFTIGTEKHAVPAVLVNVNIDGNLYGYLESIIEPHFDDDDRADLVPTEHRIRQLQSDIIELQFHCDRSSNPDERRALKQQIQQVEARIHIAIEIRTRAGNNGASPRKR